MIFWSSVLINSMSVFGHQENGIYQFMNYWYLITFNFRRSDWLNGKPAYRGV